MYPLSELKRRLAALLDKADTRVAVVLRLSLALLEVDSSIDWGYKTVKKPLMMMIDSLQIKILDLLLLVQKERMTEIVDFYLLSLVRLERQSTELAARLDLAGCSVDVVEVLHKWDLTFARGY